MSRRRHAGLLRPLASDALEMNHTPPASSANTSSAQPIQQPLDVKALAVALAGIRSDSQRESEIYLRDTVVPHGGE